MTSFLVAALLAVQTLAAQTPAPQTPQFKAGVDVVEVDVSVLDKNGKPVTDLRASDFEVRERGDLQRVDTIFLVAPMARPAPAAPGAAPASTPAAPPAANAAVTVRPAPPRVFVFVFDISHLSAAGFERSRTAIRTFLTDGLRPEDFAGLVVNGNMLGNRIVSDKGALLSLLDGMGPPNLTRFSEMRQWPRLLSEEEAFLIARGNEGALKTALTRACNERSGACDGFGGTAVETDLSNKAALVAGESARDAQTTLTVLQTLANGLGRFPGPKHVVFFSEGFYTGDFSERVTQVSGLAARNNVRLSTLDARGLNTDPRMQNLFGESPTVSNSDLAVLGNDTYADVLTTLALETGGERIRNRNNLRPSLDRIAEISGTYYVLGYAPTKPFDGSYRAIDVKVKRPDVTVVARRGYLAAKPPPVNPAATSPGQPASGAETPATAPTPPPAAATPATPTPTSPPPTSPSPASRTPGVPTLATPPTATPGTTAPATPVVRIRPGGNPEAGAVGERLTGKEAASASAAGEVAKEGWNLYAAGKVEEARDKLAAATKAGAGIWAEYALGLAEFTLQHAEAAAASWQRVRTAEPTYEPVYFDLADAYLQLGRSSDALAVLRDAARRWPKDSETHNAVGVVLISRGAVDDAIDSFERAVNVAPDDGLGYFNLGRAYHFRYLRRLRSSGSGYSGTAAQSLATADRQKAVTNYKKCISIGGPFEKDAKEALAGLEWGKSAM
jgi:VWFA-related protein